MSLSLYIIDFSIPHSPSRFVIRLLGHTGQKNLGKDYEYIRGSLRYNIGGEVICKS